MTTSGMVGSPMKDTVSLALVESDVTVSSKVKFVRALTFGAVKEAVAEVAPERAMAGCPDAVTCFHAKVGDALFTALSVREMGAPGRLLTSGPASQVKDAVDVVAALEVEAGGAVQVTFGGAVSPARESCHYNIVVLTLILPGNGSRALRSC